MTFLCGLADTPEGDGRFANRQRHRTSPVGILIKLSSPPTMKLLNFLKPKPTIESYGQPNGVSPEQVQSLMEWLFASLLKCWVCWF
ncbi:MAG: hypothetical protein HC815_40720 [Richelia sp. RM1_1_1]|nr:hypothetical protein [Richelia sp. RM1_1_1]